MAFSIVLVVATKTILNYLWSSHHTVVKSILQGELVAIKDTNA